MTRLSRPGGSARVRPITPRRFSLGGARRIVRAVTRRSAGTDLATSGGMQLTEETKLILKLSGIVIVVLLMAIARVVA